MRSKARQSLSKREEEGFMKRWFSPILACFVALAAFCPLTALAEEPAMGEGLDAYLNENSFEENGSLMVPLRALTEGIGGEILWSFLTETATVRYGDITMKLKENSDTAEVSGETSPITEKVKNVEGRLYAPVRFVAENLGLCVNWNDETQKVSVSLKAKNADTGHLYHVVSVSASGDDGNKPEGVLDRNYQTRWSCDEYGAYITLELDEVCSVAYIGVANYKGDERQETLSVQISEDGNAFKEVVTKFVVPERTLAMVPVDLGGVYNAKYVRVIGYGNTQNDWNSFTEISVYGPMEDGSMPVATDGSTASTGSVADLAPEQRAALSAFEKLFSRLDVWYANLYHHEDGGFYMTMSGRDDPEIDCGLEMTFFALGSVTGYSDAGDIPEPVKQRLINYIKERQDPKTGLFIDKQGPVNDRETARNQNSVMGYVNSWKVDLPYQHPSQTKKEGSGGSSVDAAVMPDYMKSVDSYINWVENNWDWDKNSWTAGDQTQQSLTYLRYLPQNEYEAYKAALLEWLANRQFKDTGYWSPNVDFNSVSGAFKVGLVYQELGEVIPNADKVMETTIKCMETAYPTVAHYVRNPISLLLQISNYGPEYQTRIRQAITENMEKICGWVNQFLAPDGGFAQYHGKSMSNFGGIYGSHQLWEGDVDSTLMILVARKEVYALMGVSAPALQFSPDFWDWIEEKKPTPSPYEDGMALNGDENKTVSFDFEDAGLGALDGTEFGGTAFSNMTAEIVKDADRRDNQCLSLSYDGSLSSGGGPNFSVLADAGYQVLYRPDVTEETVTEFDLKIKNPNGYNTFYVGIGNAPAYAVNFQQTALGTRIDDMNVQYGGTICSLRENEWYRIRVEYTKAAKKENFKAKIYVDGELVSTNQNYYNMLTAAPADPFGKLSVTWYRAGSGTVMLDNISMQKIVK